jgi:plastocyanin
MRNVLPLVAALALAGCGGSESSSEQPPPATEPPASQAPSGTAVTVTETEFSIAPATINVPAPGMYTIKVVNKGQVTHALEIEGHGAEAETEDIAPGESAQLRINLTKAGSYEVYCPVDGHKDKGMTAALVIGNATGAPTQTTTEEETTTRSGY